MKKIGLIKGPTISQTIRMSNDKAVTEERGVLPPGRFDHSLRLRAAGDCAGVDLLGNVIVILSSRHTARFVRQAPPAGGARRFR